MIESISALTLATHVSVLHGSGIWIQKCLNKFN